MRPSDAEPSRKFNGPTNAHAPRDHSSSIQHFVVAPSKFSRNPGNQVSNCVSAELILSLALIEVTRSAARGRLLITLIARTAVTFQVGLTISTAYYLIEILLRPIFTLVRFSRWLKSR